MNSGADADSGLPPQEVFEHPETRADVFAVVLSQAELIAVEENNRHLEGEMEGDGDPILKAVGHALLFYGEELSPEGRAHLRRMAALKLREYESLEDAHEQTGYDREFFADISELVTDELLELDSASRGKEELSSLSAWEAAGEDLDELLAVVESEEDDEADEGHHFEHVAEELGGLMIEGSTGDDEWEEPTDEFPDDY